MESRLFIEVSVLVILTLISGVLAMAELAIVSSRRERLQMLVDNGDKGALMALHLSREPTAFLSTVQVGITLIGILIGAFGSASLTDALAQLIAHVEVLEPYSRTIALAVVVGTITFFNVVLGELVPKRLALRNPERFAAALARPMSLLASVARPLVRLLTLATMFFLRVLGIKGDL
ncbi:MAG TPA: CNNM domain-containing protein, partial [Promineifilum sp.]|nr:CNNM domain-containing protein [Promineifilum sp.]